MEHEGSGGSTSSDSTNSSSTSSGSTNSSSTSSGSTNSSSTSSGSTSSGDPTASACTALEGKAFESVLPRPDCGDGCHYTLSFTAYSSKWTMMYGSHGDALFGGPVQCSGASILLVTDMAGGTENIGTYDAAQGKLTFDNVEYKLKTP